MERITQLETDKISSNLALQDEYNSIIEEISAIQDKSVGLITTRQDTTNEKTIKFISGGILLWFVSLLVLFQKNKRESISIFKRIIYNLVATALCVALGYILALVGRSIPTIINVWINAIAFPCIQIAIIALIVYGSSNKS